jgi:hypothetical protein
MFGFRTRFVPNKKIPYKEPFEKCCKQGFELGQSEIKTVSHRYEHFPDFSSKRRILRVYTDEEGTSAPLNIVEEDSNSGVDEGGLVSMREIPPPEGATSQPLLIGPDGTAYKRRKAFLRWIYMNEYHGLPTDIQIQLELNK